MYKIQIKMEKRPYSKPMLKRIKIDNKISMIMMSPPSDPETYTTSPFKIKWIKYYNKLYR